MAKYFKVDGWVRQQLGGDGKRNVSINCLKVEREDGVGDHPWVEAALRAGKVFSAVTHSSSAFHNNRIQQEKVWFEKVPSLPIRTFCCFNVTGGIFVANMHICQLCWKGMEERMANSASRLKGEEERLTEPGGS